MTDQEKNSFFEQYASQAMEQQVRYGIPASVTLAQMALESGWGNGRPIKEANNAFCVKGNYNGQFILVSDDKRNEHFKKYPNLQASFDDHSKVLMGKHYAHCRNLSATDYRGWCIGLQSGASTGGKYASAGNYSSTLIGMINKYGLAKYDQLAMEQARSQGKTCGYMRGSSMSSPSYPPVGTTSNGLFSLPIKGGWHMVLTSDFGHRNTGISGASTNHYGIDLRADHVPLQATECGGRIKAVDAVGNNKSGKHVVVEYNRGGHTYTVSYCHLDSIASGLKVGYTVNAGDSIGVSGNSSYRDFDGSKPLDPHLHLTVRRDGEYYDPKKYLGEISALGAIYCEMVRKGGSREDLLASSRADTLARMSSDPNYLASQLSKVGSQDSADLAQQQPSARQQEQDADKQENGFNLDGFHEFTQSHTNPLEWLAFLNSGGKEEGMGGLGFGGGDDLVGELISAVLSGVMALFTVSQLSSGGEDDSPSADISESDQAKIDVARAHGIDPEQARNSTSMFAESKLPVQQSTALTTVVRHSL